MDSNQPALPLADCHNCEHGRFLPRPVGHCYMFVDAPGKYCGQFRPFKPEPTDGSEPEYCSDYVNDRGPHAR